MILFTGSALEADILAQLKNMIDETGYEPFYLEDQYEEDAYPFPLYYYALQQRTLASFVSVLPINEHCVEITGLTAPQYRNQGLFSTLLESIIPQLRQSGITEILSEVPIHYSFVQSIASHSELLMELKNYSDRTSIENDSAQFNSVPNTSVEEFVYELGEDALEYVYLISENNIPLGILKITKENAADFAMLHHVAIRPHYRGLGHGKRLLKGALDLYFSHDQAPLHLHVTSTNLPAVSIYKAAGFKILDSLDYYLLQELHR